MRERCERTSERRSEWPSTPRVDFVVIVPIVLWRARIGHLSSQVVCPYRLTHMHSCQAIKPVYLTLLVRVDSD